VHALVDFLVEILEGCKIILKFQFLLKLDEEQRVMCDFHKLQVWFAYRINPSMEWLKNPFKDGITIIVQTFCGLKKIKMIIIELWKNPTMCNKWIIQNHEFKKMLLLLYQTNCSKEWGENWDECTPDEEEALFSFCKEIWCSENQLCMIEIL